MLEVLDEACTSWGMCISVSKTKFVQVRTGQHQPISEQPITLQGQTLEEVQSFLYLGSEVDQSERVQKEITVRLEKAGRVYQMWRRKLFRNRNISISTKMRAFRTLVMSVLLYGALDLGSNAAGHPEVENLPNEVLERYSGSQPLEHAAEHSGP